jgi:hypothetical protein
MIPNDPGQAESYGAHTPWYLGPLSPINKALQGEPSVVGLGKTSNVRAPLMDLADMVENLAHQLIHVRELVPTTDHYKGYCDPCGAGAGKVWLSGDINLCPLVW